MKKTIIALSFATSQLFAACPDLTGIWEGECIMYGMYLPTTREITQTACAQVKFKKLGRYYSWNRRAEDYKIRFKRTSFHEPL